VTHPHRLFAALLAVCLLGAIPTMAEAKTAKTAKTKTKYYLSLGDSLSVGVQPNAAGVSKNTKQGYPRQLAKLAGKVKLVEYGCGNATTESFLKGNRKCAPARKPGYKNTSPGTSQAAAAVKFIKKHKDQIAFVTIDIGANDVATCAKPTGIDIPCVSKGVAAIKKNAGVIAKKLRKAGGKKMPMAVMTLYDPFLQQWLISDAGKGIAQASVGLAKDQVNDVIAKAFKKHKFKVADVATAFDTYVPFSKTTTLSGRTGVPVAVAQVCKLTWMCNPKPVGPNIHANKKGYALIAKTFRKALGKAAR
jgi:lysophospholipase L1-like esterase